MDDVPDSAPDHCPGTKSGDAGKVSACKGCPNQSICSSGLPKGPDPAVGIIRSKLSLVKHKLLVLSGKGGVGKSTVTSMLAHALSRDENFNVALLDIDLCGPSLPKIMGLEGEQVHQSGSGWSPIFVTDNLSLMSIGFLLGSLDDAVIWRGPRKTGLIKQFLAEVDWGTQDLLLVDTPPGTSDEHLAVAEYLSGAVAVLVTTPQEVALQDVRKEWDACKRLNIPVLGVIENMAGFVCPKCDKESFIFPADSGGAQSLCDISKLPLLGRLPLDPNIARCCDEGTSFFNEHSESPAAKAYIDTANAILQLLESKTVTC